MDRRNLLTKLLMVFLVLMFLGGITLGAIEVLSAEGQEPPEANYQQSLTQRPESKEEIIQYLNYCVDYAKAEKTKLDINTELSIDDDSVSFGENGDMLKKSFIYAKDSLLDNLMKKYPESSFDFGRDYSEKLWNLKFDPVLIAGSESKEEADNYTFKILFPDEENPFGMIGVVNQSFHMSNTQAVFRYLWDSCKNFASVDDVKVRCTGLEIDSNVNRLTNKISNIIYIKKMVVEADITFLGELSPAGTRKMTFTVEEKTNFNFTWANLTLSPKTLNMEKGDILVINALITASGDVKAKWLSSNPAVASVGSDGYVKGEEISKEPVMISAEFDFLGKKYTDTCEVYVKVPVKKVKISQKKLNMKTGSTAKLDAYVKPDDATIKEVLWFSKDPTIAKVDKNGNVTAVSKGGTEIYILSKDGYYKISCAVTVTD